MRELQKLSCLRAGEDVLAYEPTKILGLVKWTKTELFGEWTIGREADSYDAAMWLCV